MHCLILAFLNKKDLYYWVHTFISQTKFEVNLLTLLSKLDNLRILVEVLI